jgi:hypothetical protein
MVETNTFLTRQNRQTVEATGISESAGAGDANKLVATNEDGKIDPSLLSGSNSFTGTAATAIGGLRTVYLDDDGNLDVADPDTAPAVGLIRDAVSADESVTVYQSGPVNGFAGLTEGARYYMGASGVPTETPVTVGFSQSIGTAQSDTVLIVKIGESVEI